MHEVWCENGACSRRTSQAGLRSAHIRVHKVQQRRSVHRGIRSIFAVVAGRQGQLGHSRSAPRLPRHYSDRPVPKKPFKYEELAAIRARLKRAPIER